MKTEALSIKSAWIVELYIQPLIDTAWFRFFVASVAMLHLDQLGIDLLYVNLGNSSYTSMVVGGCYPSGRAKNLVFPL